MGKVAMRAADGAKAPPSLEENYRRWLRSMRDRIDSELASEERAAEWLKKTLPRLEDHYKRLHRKRIDENVAPGGDPRPQIIRYLRDDEMPEESKLQMLKDFVVESLLGEAEARIRDEEEEEKKREREKERLRMKKRLVATGVMLSSFAVAFVTGLSMGDDDMSPSELLRFLCFEYAMLALFGASAVARDRLSPPPLQKCPTMTSCPAPDGSRVGLLDLLPS